MTNLPTKEDAIIASLHKLSLQPTGAFESDVELIQNHFQQLKETDPAEYMRITGEMLEDLKNLQEILTQFEIEIAKVKESQA